MSLFFGRNVAVETNETIKVGSIVLNNKPMRIKVYTIQDDLNMLRNAIMELKLTVEERNDILDKCNKLKKSINDL